MLREEDRGYSFGIFRKGGNELVGTVSLSMVARGALQKCMIGYSLDQFHNGCGYTTEAVKLAVRYAFEELKLHRVEAGVMPENIGSLRVLEKAGFQKEGIERKGVEINGQWQDHQILSILSEDI
jgi:ribosomal-protein-alanine N-acetyltransferase